jgi:phosphatidylglycerol lysyltransferase
MEYAIDKTATPPALGGLGWAGEERLCPPNGSATPLAESRASEAVSAIDDLERYSSHPSAFLALNRDTAHFRAPGMPGFIAYREAGNYLFQLGSVFAPERSQPALLREFCAKAQREGRYICALQLRPEDVPAYHEAGFHINQLGLSYTLDLAAFKTSGTRFMKMRNKIARARNSGVKVVEVGVDVPRHPALWDEINAVTASWLRGKGRHVKQLEFMIGEVGTPADTHRRIFAALEADRIIGFISYVPSYGALHGYMHDLSRRTDRSPPGVMELVNITAIERFKAEGQAYLNFGMTPFIGLSEETDSVPGKSAVVSWVLRTLAKHGKAIYPARSQVDYKMKWQPQIITPEYMAFQGTFRLGYLVRLLLLTRAI